jgi:thiol-disulfide isomerase/thioredoxin/outer membrane lipoprotein-sorting protein
MNITRKSVSPLSRIGIFCSFAVLTIQFMPALFRNLTVSGQQTDGRPEALTMLRQVGAKYANATAYRVDSSEEDEFGDEFSKQLGKSLQTAVVAPGNKYRFEFRGAREWWILVSDGQTEWLYRPLTDEYKAQAAPAHGPSHLKSSGLLSFYGLEEAWEAVKTLAELPSYAKSASYLPDESLSIGGEQISCSVIHAVMKYKPGWAPDVFATFTVWVDKKSLAVRKLEQRLEGALIMDQPQTHEVDVTTTTYQQADLDGSQIPSNIFVFAPPSSAKPVTEFKSPTLTPANLVGKAAPDVTFDSPDGKMLSLKSFQGRPVLLDFWATWCAPCVASFPSLARLYEEASQQGLILLSIDEDGEAETAMQFMAKNKHDWPNFHDDGEIVRRFPNRGIPHFVLVDSRGMVVFAESSFDEGRLRAAIVKLGPQFTSLGKPSNSSGVP